MVCPGCNKLVNAATAAADFDAGVPTWNLCDECAKRWEEDPTFKAILRTRVALARSKTLLARLDQRARRNPPLWP
jgi:hypothetical protein